MLTQYIKELISESAQRSSWANSMESCYDSIKSPIIDQFSSFFQIDLYYVKKCRPVQLLTNPEAVFLVTLKARLSSPCLQNSPRNLACRSLTARIQVSVFATKNTASAFDQFSFLDQSSFRPKRLIRLKAGTKSFVSRNEIQEILGIMLLNITLNSDKKINMGVLHIFL